MAKVKSKTKNRAKTTKAKPTARKSTRVASRTKPRVSTPKGSPKTTPRPKPKSIVLSPPSKPASARTRPVTTTKVRVVNKLYSSRGTSSEDRRMLKGLRLPQYNYMKPPGAMHDFQVGDTVEVYCDHEKNRDRVRGWIRGIVVQVDNKLVAVQFRSNVFLTDGWMVPDRILWYPLNSEHMRPVPGKKTAKREEKAIPNY